MKKFAILTIAAFALSFVSCGTATEKKVEEVAPVEEVTSVDTVTAVAADTTVVAQ
jgi:Na+-transporting methylmalonyl-CoA/oxaloacetate decarboxylase gamma subunit